MSIMKAFVLLAGLGVLLLTGCASNPAERAIEEAAPKYIGPADRYEANVRGMSGTSAQQVQLTGYGVRPDPNLTLQSLTLTFNDVSYQRQPFRITRLGSAEFSLTATDAAVTSYLLSQINLNPGRFPLRAPQVTFLQNQVRVNANAIVGPLQVPISTIGTLQTTGTQVLFFPTSISLTNATPGIVLPAIITRMQLPLVDLARLPFTPQVQRVALQTGTVTVTGSANTARLLEMQGP